MGLGIPRALPNILVTGTPGTGKSTTCEQIAEATGLKHLNIGNLVREQDLHCGWDDEFECHIIDEDKVTLQLRHLRKHWHDVCLQAIRAILLLAICYFLAE